MAVSASGCDLYMYMSRAVEGCLGAVGVGLSHACVVRGRKYYCNSTCRTRVLRKGVLLCCEGGRTNRTPVKSFFHNTCHFRALIDEGVGGVREREWCVRASGRKQTHAAIPVAPQSDLGHRPSLPAT